MIKKEKSYQLIDCENERKLEYFGDYLISRPCQTAIWKSFSDEKRVIDAEFYRKPSGNGDWKFFRAIPEQWIIVYNELRFQIRLTGFGHTGLFPEQLAEWNWFERIMTGFGEPMSILNLFAYTGGSSLVCARAGATVTHLDAAAGVVDWAKENSRLNQLQHLPIRWIVDDVQKFVAKEIRRKNLYHGIVLDPPSFGRGPKGEIWKLEDHLYPLLGELKKILHPHHAFLHLSCHTPGFTPVILNELLLTVFPERPENIESGEMLIPYRNTHWYSAGSFARIHY